MFKKDIFKKTKVIVLIVLILNLGLGSLFLAPTQIQAASMGFMNPEEVLNVMTTLHDGAESAKDENWILTLLLKHIDVEHICKSLSDIAENIMIMGTTVGTPIAILITQMCPIILNEILQAYLQTLPEPPAPENTQVIQYPIFESYQWEIGIPGFFKPGEITPFK